MGTRNDYVFEGATPAKLARAMARTAIERRKQAQKADKGQKKDQQSKKR